MRNSLVIILLVLGLTTACKSVQTVTTADDIRKRESAEVIAKEKEIERVEALSNYKEMVKELKRKHLEQQSLVMAQKQNAPDAVIKPKQPIMPLRQKISEPQPEPEKPVQRTVTKPTYRSDKEVAEQNSLYDPNNEFYDMIQKANESLIGFQTNRIGEVDWMVAIDQQRISPRSDLHGKSKAELLDKDIIMKNTKEMNYVRFPHLAHTKWLACQNCHDNIFKPQAGAHQINMNKIFSGQYCGVCHDKVAFSVYICEGCHSVPH